ncbi:phosphodiesterase [Streptomyces meridianus]|uniref:Phosphodiesterase n=1 Tax=Streptomyces meridianus TaxID=2938945 RepID=A0ABT0X3T7_9ACTN|nr:phosphodiesterase [Streptomyces meridianus]MCM2577193.1 phosphodiesterase [Streptomyces meridianus]
MTASVAHISDPHITTGPLAGPPAEGLYRALGRVLTLAPRPDCVVITGDLVERGDPEEYRALREVIGRFPLPLHVVAGNHDDPGTLLEEFGGTRFLGGAARTHYAVDFPAFTLMALDTAVPGSPGGHLGAAQLEWLDGVLARRPERPAVVCLHHPPIAVGIPFLDGMRLDDGEDLAVLLARHGNVARVLAGHVHRPVTAAFAGSTLCSAPSTHLQSGLALDGGVPDYLPEPTSFLLHLGSGPSWVTHTIPVSHAAAPIACY